MELYEIKCEYPSLDFFRSYVVVDDRRDAIAMAKGAMRVTSAKRVAVYSMDDCRCIYYDEMKASES